MFKNLKNTNYFNDYNSFLKNRFGTSGANQRITVYLFWGIVEDK